MNHSEAGTTSRRRGSFEKTEVAERYVNRLVEGAAAVSSVFQEKLRRVLAAGGRRDEEGAWRSVDEVVQTLSEIEAVAGGDVLRITGAQMLDETCIETADLQTAFTALNERTAERVHRGPAADRVGACRARRVAPQRWRVATDKEYRYPSAFAEGVFRVTTALAAGVPRTTVDLDPVSVTDDERHAVVVSW